MSMFISALPTGMGLFLNISSHFVPNVTIRTNVTSLKLLEKILTNETLGFNSNEELKEFESHCFIHFQYINGKVEVRFVGGYDENDVNIFINGINEEFKRLTNPQENNTKEYTIKKKETTQRKSFIVPSNLKDKSIINKILKENYLGYSNKSELEKFQKIGEIFINPTKDDTLDFIFIGDYDEEEAIKYVENITEEYASIIQEQTYLKVLEKIEKENLTLESEIVDNEDSIILTLNI